MNVNNVIPENFVVCVNSEIFPFNQRAQLITVELLKGCDWPHVTFIEVNL